MSQHKKNISVKCKILLKKYLILSFLDKIFKIYVETTHCKCGVFLPKWDNKIYGKYTNILLDRLALRPNMKVAIIGCGSGESIDVIYQKIGQDGKLLCLDISQKQIELTKSKLSSKNIDIAEYQVADIQDYQGNEQYDLVYCRFVLIHLILIIFQNRINMV
ncbi:class I SAM-dependent methyltransferase [Candidatus Tisiphia endosymbiont of Parasteatoda lunata]|uniref:class I SAM-dependent methyltransferase n=1 Tax=Candidatus Tisiphia endosymbiont of Parasteatoda lunata TaxID=3066275 RepID=UPI00313D8ED0